MDMQEYIDAAQTLIKRLNAPTVAHSVWVKTDVVDGEFVRSLCVSVRPGWKAKVKLPTEHSGIPVVEVPWPRGQA